MVFFISSCRKDIPQSEQDTIIYLRWVKSYEDEKIEDVITGLKWSLSYIGAKYLDESAIRVQGRIITLNTALLGLSAKSSTQLSILNSKFKSTEAYAHFRSVDIGRYIASLIGASEHYYAFVEQPSKLDDLIEQYTLTDIPGYVNESGISSKDRIIRFSDQNSLNQLYVAEEVDNVTGELLEIETLDLMTNGQPRFGIYDIEGNLVNAANPTISIAGKPAKCIWCHESKIQPLFSDQNNYPGYLSYQAFKDTLTYFNTQLETIQTTLTLGVDFSKKQDHQQTEILYISFMEPSLERLKNEWHLSEEETKQIVNHLDTHANPEFPFLGNLYSREQVESLSPHKSLTVSSSVREQSTVEVNHLK